VKENIEIAGGNRRVGRDERWFLIGAPLQVWRLRFNETLNFQ